MLNSLIVAATLFFGPFYDQKPSYCALRPVFSYDSGTVDVLWPLYTRHRDWWRFAFIAGGYSRTGAKGDSSAFWLFPFWYHGDDPETGRYAGFFPFYGRHPHMLMAYDLEFALWPLWTRFKTPRAGAENGWLETNAVLFPFINWRSDGSWAVWPLYGVKHQRESLHRYALWPIALWATYRADRDTSGAGYSWMLLPLAGRVNRERESQWMFIPPFFSYTETVSPARKVPESGKEFRIRCPWPFFEWERTLHRRRLSVWPLYEDSELLGYSSDGERTGGVTRFGWRLVEIYRDGKGRVEETRLFPFWAKGRDYLRIWPFWESRRDSGADEIHFLSLLPIRWIPAVDRNWAPFWSLYSSRETDEATEHSLLWGFIRWKSQKRK